MTTYYVTTSGSDSNNGLTEGTAFATPGYAVGQASAGDIIYVKDGTYTLTTTTANVSGGPIDLGSNKLIEGYLSTAGDQAAKPIIHCGSVAPTRVVFSSTTNNGSNKSTARSMKVDGNNQTGVQGFYLYGGYFNPVFNCDAVNCDYGFVRSSCNCYAENCTYGFGWQYSSGGGPFEYCIAKSCDNGFMRPKTLFSCIAYDCTSHGFNLLNSLDVHIYNCTAYNNGGDGFGYQSAAYGAYNMLVNCLAVNNTGYGFYDGPLKNCAAYGNGTDFRTRQTPDHFLFNQIQLTSDPFVNAPSDFSLNDVSGGGLDCQGVGSKVGGNINSYSDIGAVQNQVTAGGGGSQFHPLG